VTSYAAYLERAGHEICRLQFWPEGEAAPLFCDMYDKTTNTLIEAKGTVSRPAIRMAVGQLADYARLMSALPDHRALLVPANPRPDLIELVRSEQISIIYPIANGFETSPSAD
jgi:hypothetical protein